MKNFKNLFAFPIPCDIIPMDIFVICYAKEEIALAKRGRRAKKNKVDVNVAVVFMILISILLAILIYTKSGYIGEHLSPILGGIMGVIKYIIPVGTFLIAIYMTTEDKEYLVSKLIQYAIFLVCIATMLSVFQFSNGNLNVSNQFEDVVSRGYELGEMNNGGGVIGTAIAYALIGLLGEIGTVILCIGVGAILLVFMFGIKPANINRLVGKPDSCKAHIKAQHPGMV